MTHKFTLKTQLLFKNSLLCFGFLKSRIYEGKIHTINLQTNSVLLDCGYPLYVTCFLDELSLPIAYKNLTLLTIYNKVKKFSIFQFKILGSDQFFANQFLVKQYSISHVYFLNYLLKNQTTSQKFYLKARILNFTKGGYSVGLCGFVSFLPSSHVYLNYLNYVGTVVAVYIVSINIINNSVVVVLSQRKLDKLLERQLWKLSSKFMFIKKNS